MATDWVWVVLYNVQLPSGFYTWPARDVFYTNKSIVLCHSLQRHSLSDQIIETQKGFKQVYRHLTLHTGVESVDGYQL